MITRLLKYKARQKLDKLLAPYLSVSYSDTGADKASQIHLVLTYQELLRSGGPLPAFDTVGFRTFSQTNEDGILLYIFALIGTANKHCVEICAGDGIECNSANLIINHGWTGLLVDGDEQNVTRGKTFYARHPDTFVFPPTFLHAWVDTSNVNTLMTSHGFAGEIDLLSIDLDGVDYWIWKAIACINPRVVVVEYQDIWGPDKAVTVPYTQDFSRFAARHDYHGASLLAFVKLARAKGYRLVGCNRYGYNAFFIRQDVGEEIFPEIPVADCFTHPKNIQGYQTRLPKVEHYEWVEV